MTEENKNNKSESALREEKVLEFWKENKIFQKSMDKPANAGEFVFYEGPPTANGKPGIHHLEARAFKDVIPRYKTMRGFHVRRKGGWDTHGLPVELQVEKKLGLNSKKAIEEYGVAKFNKECKENVWEYLEFWNKFTERIGYWVDQENPYVTYDNTYIESLWNVVKKVDDQNLLYKDYKVVPWCPRCGTALSSHELAQGYEDVKDLSLYVKFKVKGQENTYILAWTTTPWTLPGNVALAVGSEIMYVKAINKNTKDVLILSKSNFAKLFEAGGEYEVIGKLKGSDLVGLEYEPLFPYMADTISDTEKEKLEKKAYRVYAADFVTTEDGTGVVHTAVMYGQDDFVLGTEVGLPKHHLVNLEGKFISGTGFLEGRFVKEVDEKGKPTLAVDIINYLTERNLFFKKENYEHSYPHCWRCKTALIYYARDSWYIRMSDPKVKGEMIAQNKEINWEPSHIRDGRFGEWLREIKDWAISRERYWGTPLPVWLAEDGEKFVVDSLDTLKKYSKKSGNKYYVMRHGNTESNMRGVVSFKKQKDDHLTIEGRKQVIATANYLKDKGIDLIVTSPFTRTKETTEIVRDVFGLTNDQIVEDDRIHELDPGDYDGKSWEEYHEHVKNTGPDWFERKIANGESYADVKRRTAEALYELEEKYKDKKILIVTHGAPAWLFYVNSGLFEPDDKEYHPAKFHAFIDNFKRFENAEFRPLPFSPLPHNEEYNLDLHRPYIDDVTLEKDGKEFVRTKEVMDVWFDSGAMPFAQDHYPFENKEFIDGAGYPADYISEAIDQTRGWFYTLHAVGVLMGRGRAYKNVICLGHLLDEKGKKMSKSLGNIVDPWSMIEKYGVDTLRLWMYSVNQPGEAKNFDEKTVHILHSQVFGLLYNVLAFYDLYREQALEIEDNFVPKNILDVWIMARLSELLTLTTEHMDAYKVLEPTRAIRDFMSDISTWYLRRSRDRIKDGEEQDQKEAKQTMYFVLKNLVKVMAPFAPFAAEDIWLKLRNDKDEESVHLAAWPELKSFANKKVIVNMKFVRDTVSLGLEARQKAGIKVRQPLAKIEVKNLKLGSEFTELIKDELNVKEVLENTSIEGEVLLDSNLTSELKQEGDFRELVRGIQDIRKVMGLVPSDIVSLSLDTDKNGQGLALKFEKELTKVVGAKNILFVENDGTEVKVDELKFKIKLYK